MKLRIVPGLVMALIAAAALAVLLPILVSATNCGGNSYVLTACEDFVVAAEVAAQDNKDQFEVGKIDTHCLAMIAKDCWGVCGTNFLVRTNFALGSSTNHEVVIVCTRKFANVPQPTVWNLFHKNPAHGVGYSDGTIGLISPTEFSNLHLDGFVSVVSLITNSQLNVLRN